MKHKKFHRIRLISNICGAAVIIALIICVAVALMRANGSFTKGILFPILIIAGVAGIILLLLFGRFFCGFLCPLGLFQDVVWKITEKLHFPKLSRNEKFMKVLNIFNRVFLGFFICGITALIVTFAFFPEILRKIKIPILLLATVLPIVMTVLNSFARRLFCNVCPIGSFLGLFRKANLIKLEKDCTSCTECGACYEACPMRIKSVYTETESTDVSDPRCIYCGECIRKCPNDNALSVTVCKKKIYTSSTEDFSNDQFSGVTFEKGNEK